MKNVQKIWQILLVSFFTLAIACGDDSKPKDRCLEPSNSACLGSCDPATGECTNACETSEDCFAGVCADGTCVVDQCGDTTCDRGVCAVATGMCVNSEVCTPETESTDCLDGFSCYGQSCVGADDFCSTLTCDRGVCSFAEKACANADSCAMDAECLDGFFCDGGSCTQNVCDADMVMCARGVCEGTTGECVNAQTCTSGTQCLDNNYCVAGVCIDVATACESCPGNQVCEYDQAMTVTCGEPTFCSNTYDCLGDRVCDAGSCSEAGACVNDALEPFDSSAPSAIAEGAGFVSATICGADEDAFSYDTLADTDFTGTLVVVVRLKAEHVGRGELAFELKNEAGTSVATGMTVNGVGRLTKTIGNLDGGVYTAVIAKTAEISTAGIDYQVFMDLLDATTVAACEAPTTLAATQTGNTLSGASLGLSPSCAVSGSPAEDVFMFDVTAESVVTLTLTPANGADLVISLRTSCEVDRSEIACVNDSATQEQFVRRLTPGRYFAVIQAASTNSGGAYTLTYSAELPVCSPADNSCADVNVASICNAAGTGFEVVTCDQGCDSDLGRCSRAESDVCYTAIDASNGYQGVIDWDLLTNDFEPEAACVPGTGTTRGPDAAFLVVIPPMSVLTVNLSSYYDYLSIYLVRDCDNVENTCFSGVEGSEDETLTYVNTKSTAESVYVIADVESFPYYTADISISVEASICTPGVATCAASVVTTCNTAGTAYLTDNCGFGCDAAGTACNPPPNDFCGAGAVDISASGTYMIDTTAYQNSYELTSANCTGYRTSGPDAVFQISGQPGDVVDVSMSSRFDAALYALTDCGDFGSCLDGSDSGSTEQISFILPDANPVYVIADGFGSSSKGVATLTVNIRTPNCNTPNESVACLDATSLQYCDAQGFLTPYTCAGGCLSGACQAPSGDVCWDTIPAIVGGTYTGTFSGATDALNPGASCILTSDPSQDGGDTIYSLILSPGETLVADLTTTSTTAGMYLLTACDATTCEYGVGQSKHLEYYSQNGGNYFLVIDNSTTSSASYSLNITSQLGNICQPGGASCDLAGNLTICSDDGLSVVGTVTCPNGCTAGYCDAAATLNDTCASAMPLSTDIRLRQTFAGLTADYNPGSTGCTQTSVSGPDAVYAITLAPGQLVEATVRSTASSNAPAVYFVSDCSDVSTTCSAGKVGVKDSVTFGYYSAAGETVYMVVDTKYSTSAAFLLDVKFKPSECVPGDALCSGPSTLSTCNSYGVYEESDCYFGCAGSVCNPAPNELCSGAIDIGAGGSFQGDISLFTNDYNPGSNGCTGYAEVGPDAAYVVTAPAGDVVQIDATVAFNVGLYVVTDCADLATCIVGVDDYGTTSLTVVSTGVPLYIIMDSYSSTATGTYDLTVGVSTPICVPGSLACNDGSNVELCNSVGTAVDVYPCDQTCTPGNTTCDNGGSCASAIPVLQSGTIAGTWYPWQTNYTTDDYGTCTGYESIGPENVYAVSLTAGQTLTVDLSATQSAQDSSLYLITDCSAVETSCLAGDDGYGTDETVTYTATADITVYIVADNYDDVIYDDPTYSLTVTIQ